MNKTIKYLALAAMAVSANVSAHTQQTYMSLRSSNVNLPMENTTFYERTQMKLEGRFGGNLQVSGFYGESHNDVGSYFGINNKSTYTLLKTTAGNTKSNPTDFDLGYIIHDYNNVWTNGESAKVSLDPKSKQYGARFDYYQNMDKLLKGLYLKVNTTVVCVENEMEMSVNSDDQNIKDTLSDYFKGLYSETTAGAQDQQAALVKGLMSGEHSETGLADIDVILGYKFLFKDKYHVGINLAITIPTGNDPDGVQMFEPIYGNHSHFGFGGGLDAHANLWTKGEQDIKLNFMLNYRYLFEASEHRPLKLKNYASPYVLLGVNGQQTLVPAVNVLTPLGVDVTPGSQLDGILALAYNNGGFCFDLGYNMFYREDEDVHVKGTLTAGTYGVAARNFQTNANFNVTTAAEFDGAAVAVLTNDNIDANAAATPSVFTNGIYGGLGYHFKKWDYPLLMGIGGKYDWANENSNPDSWSVWLKLALSF
jgi:hypothetical protein